MLEKIRQVNNPLTIIAVFAGIAEISGTVVLPLLSLEVQHIYVWFLIVFPLLLVVLFFATLNFNHKVLYAPSDYRSDEGFFRTFRPLTPEEKQQKVEREAEQLIPRATFQVTDRDKFVKIYQEAEQLVRRAIGLEYGKESVRWDVVLQDGGRRRVLDGLIDRDLQHVEYGQEAQATTVPSDPIAVKISVFLEPVLRPGIFVRLNEYLELFGRVVLVAVASFEESELKNFEKQLADAIKAQKPRVELKVYSLAELRRKFG
jgi:hypothetical protein